MSTLRAIKTDKSPAAVGPYSQAIVANGFVFTSGQLPINPETKDFVGADVKEQVRQTLLNVSNVLQAANSSLSRAVKINVYIKDMNDFAAVNDAYAEILGDARPARACIEAARLPKDFKVEIDAIAIVNE
ncbi:3436_t:CDS:2 [Acaulospora morrowiae]|uniref:3436_t:CDS:1 n=1 Tax=Acaulospora morrowiae TaxID=94023 RepID=A0A9N9C6M2_9GLOM|nr:3436_t:CDS:2 [Acaulospora morrowiae]